jgi:hypothetical protein
VLKTPSAIDGKFLHGKEFVWQNVIYPQCGRDGREGPAKTGTLLQESILKISTDGAVSVGNGYIVEVPYYDERMAAFVYLVPDDMCLF